MYEELINQLREAERYAKEALVNPYRFSALYGKAADAIEELNLIAESNMRSSSAWADTAAAAIEQIPRWIPVTERLPDYPGRFMCYYEVNDYNDYGEIGHCIDWGRYDPDDGWYAGSVTHWMPIPEPPKEEP